MMISFLKFVKLMLTASMSVVDYYIDKQTTKQASVILLCMLCVQSAVHAETFTGHVGSVIDGDTIKMNVNNQLVVVRLAFIDAPELKQKHGEASKRFLTKLALGQEVMVASTSHDCYGRKVGIVILPELSSIRSVNEQMLEYGQAWYYGTYDRAAYRAKHTELEQFAKDYKYGLWQEKKPIPPWEFRKLQKEKRK